MDSRHGGRLFGPKGNGIILYMKNESEQTIDFVIPWVDGSDSAWRAEHDRWAAKEQSDSYLAKWNEGEQRYRDWGLLKYWFRGVEMFAPWVNKIHFITWGHLPSWLEISHPKLHVVRHEDFIPRKWLPTFSSRCIDLNLHRIPGLSEKFVYFNDDMFLTAPTKATDFFRKGLPCDAAIISPIYLKQNGVRAEINAMYVINAHFRKWDVISSHPLKWFSPCYGMALVRTLTQFPFRLFTGFYIHHLPTSFLKSSFDDVWAEEPDLLGRSCGHRFRNDMDVNQWIIQFWQYATGKFFPRSPKFGIMYEGGAELSVAASDITTGRHHVVCWNDAPDIKDFEGYKKQIGDSFGRILSQRSSFERLG